MPSSGDKGIHMITKTFAAIGASALALAIAAPAAAQSTPAKGAPSAPATAAVAPAPEAPLPTMTFGNWGYDPAGLDRSIDPGDDFFAFANAKWLAANPLPPQFSRFGAFNFLGEKSTADVKTLIDELVAKDPAQLTADEKRIVAVYQSYLDTAAIDAAGLAPAQPYLAKIKGANTLAEMATLWGEVGYPSPIGGGVTVDAKEPDRYSVCARLGRARPARPRLLSRREREGQGHPGEVPRLPGVPARRGAAMPTPRAWRPRSTRSRTRSRARFRGTAPRARNRDLTYNRLTPEEVGELSPSFPMAAFLASSGLAGTDRYLFCRPAAHARAGEGARPRRGDLVKDRRRHPRDARADRGDPGRSAPGVDGQGLPQRQRRGARQRAR